MRVYCYLRMNNHLAVWLGAGECADLVSVIILMYVYCRVTSDDECLLKYRLEVVVHRVQHDLVRAIPNSIFVNIARDMLYSELRHVIGNLTRRKIILIQGNCDLVKIAC